MNILIIEDNPEVAEAISLCFQLRWPETVIAHAVEGNIGLKMLKSQPFDLVVLDLNLPDADGLKILGSIRAFSNVPVVIVTVRANEEDRVKGLEMGADDYIVKPYQPKDLVARANAVLRRSQLPKTADDQPYITRGKLTMNIATNEVTLPGGVIARLTVREARLLHLLMKNAGNTMCVDQLLEQTWGKEYHVDTLRTYIRRVRDKLKDKPPQMIVSDHGGGYRFVAPN